MRSDRTVARWAVIAMVCVVVVGVAAAPQQQGPPFAFVNADEILRQTPGYAAADSTFSADMESFRAEVRQLEMAFDSAVSRFNQQEPMLSPTMREQRMTELRQMQQQAQLRQEELTQRAQERQGELMAPLEDRINRVIDGLRAERNIGIVFNADVPVNFIISADPSMNLTAVVVQRLTGGGP